MGLLATYAQTQAQLGTTQAPGGVSALPSTYQPVDDRSGHGLFGFIGNIGADVKDILGGVYQLAATGVKEVLTEPVQVGKELVTLGLANTDVQVATPSIVPHIIGGMLSDWKDRYLDGDFTAELYDHPLSFVSDLLMAEGAVTGVGRAMVGGEGFAGAAGKLAAAASPEFAAKMAANRGLLELYRAGKLASVAPEGGLVAGETVKLADALGQAGGAAGRLQGVMDVAQSGLSGLESIGQLAKRWSSLSPEARKAMFLDFSNPEALAIADATSGYVAHVAPTFNPLVRAVWSDPLRAKFLTDDISKLTDEISRLKGLDEVGQLDLAGANQLRQLEQVVQRASEGGAKLVAKPIYGSIYMRARMAKAADKMLGTIIQRSMLARKLANKDLYNILKDSGASPDFIEKDLSNLLQGLDDGNLVSMPDDVLTAELATKGYGSMAEAAQDMIHQTGNHGVLSIDERNALLRKVKDGQLGVQDLWRYQPDAELLGLPERTRFEAQLRDATAKAGIPESQANFLMASIDSINRALARNNPRYGGSVDAVFRDLSINFEDTWNGTRDGLFQTRVNKVLRGAVSLDPKGRARLDVRRLANLVRTDVERTGDARGWWANGKKFIHELTAGQTTEISPGRVIRDSELLTDLLAVTSIGLLPEQQLAAATQIYMMIKNGTLEEFTVRNPKTGAAQAIINPFYDGTIEHGPAQLTMREHGRNVARLVDEVAHGHLIRDWEAEIAAKGSDLPISQIVDDFAHRTRNLTLNDRQKVRAMAANLKGDFNRATVDRRIGMIFGVFTSDRVWEKAFGDVFSKVRKELDIAYGISGARYRTLDDYLRQVKDYLNNTLSPEEVPYTTAEVQAVLWARTKDFLAEEQAKMTKRLSRMSPAEREAAKPYLALVNAAMTGESMSESDFITAWEKLGKSGYGKMIQTRLARLVGKPSQLAQEVAAEIKGATMFGPDFTAAMKVFRSGDFTTFVHEYGHVLRHLMPEEISQQLFDIYKVRAHPGKTTEQVFAEAGDELFQTRHNAGYRFDQFATVDTPAGELGLGQFVTWGDDPIPRRIMLIEKKGERFYATLDSGKTKVPMDELVPVEGVEPWRRGLVEPEKMPTGAEDVKSRYPGQDRPLYATDAAKEQFTQMAIRHNARLGDLQREGKTPAEIEAILGSSEPIPIDYGGYPGRSKPNTLGRPMRNKAGMPTRGTKLERTGLEAALYNRYVGADGEISVGDTVKLPGDQGGSKVLKIAGSVRIDSTGGIYRVDIVPMVETNKGWFEAAAIAGPPVAQPPVVEGVAAQAAKEISYTPKAVEVGTPAERIGADPVAKDVASRFDLSNYDEDKVARMTGSVRTAGESPGYYLMEQAPVTGDHATYFVASKEALSDPAARMDKVVYKADENARPYVDRRVDAPPPDAPRWKKYGATATKPRQRKGPNVAAERAAYEKKVAEQIGVADLPPDRVKKLLTDVAAEPTVIADAEVSLEVMDDIENRMWARRRGADIGEVLEPGTYAYRQAQESGIYVTGLEQEYEVPATLPVGTRVAFQGEGVNVAELGIVVEMDPKQVILGNQVISTKLDPLGEVTATKDYESLPVLYKHGDQLVAAEGNHRTYRARQLGEAKIKVVVVDGDHLLRDQISVTPAAAEEMAAAMGTGAPVLGPKNETYAKRGSRALYADTSDGRRVYEGMSVQTAEGQTVHVIQITERAKKPMAQIYDGDARRWVPVDTLDPTPAEALVSKYRLEGQLGVDWNGTAKEHPEVGSTARWTSARNPDTGQVFQVGDRVHSPINADEGRWHEWIVDDITAPVSWQHQGKKTTMAGDRLIVRGHEVPGEGGSEFSMPVVTRPEAVVLGPLDPERIASTKAWVDETRARVGATEAPQVPETPAPEVPPAAAAEAPVLTGGPYEQIARSSLASTSPAGREATDAEVATLAQRMEQADAALPDDDPAVLAQLAEWRDARTKFYGDVGSKKKPKASEEALLNAKMEVLRRQGQPEANPAARAEELSRAQHPEYDQMTAEQRQAAMAPREAGAPAPKAGKVTTRPLTPEDLARLEGGGEPVAAAPVAAAAEGGVPPELPPGGAPPSGGEPPALPPKNRWTRAMEEQFAQDFEQWFYKGIKPSDPRTLPALRVMAEQIMDVWKKVRGYLMDNGLVPPETQAVFDEYLGDAFRIMSQGGEDKMPAALYRGRRRARVIQGIQDLAQVYGDGREVQQLPSAEGRIQAGELRARAIKAAETTVPKLRAVFGKNVRTELKDAVTIQQRLSDGLRVLDAVRSRVVIASWTEVDQALQQLRQAGMEIKGVEDLRGFSGSGGKRGVTAFFVDPSAPGIVQELEIGTPLFDRFRDATFRHDQALNKIDVDIAKEEQAIARLSASTNPNQAGVQTALNEHIKTMEYLTAQREAGRRYMEGFNEMLTDEIAQHFGQPVPMSPERATVNEIRLWVAKHLEQELFDRGYFDFQYAFERGYLPMRLKSGAKWDEELGDYVGGKSAYVLDDERAAAGLPSPVYFPHIEASAPTDFILQRSGKGQRKMAENKNLRRNRGSLFEEGTYITDPMTAYSTRAARAIKMRDTYEWIAKTTQTFGRKIDSPDGLLPGEKLLAPDFTMAFFKAVIGIEDRLGSLLNNLDTTELIGALGELNAKAGRTMAPEILAEGIGRTLGIGEKEAGALYLAVSEAIPKVQRQLVGITGRGIDMYAVPEVVAKRLAESVRYQMGPKVRLFWDKPTQLWRALTLYGRPAWVINNLLGNVAFSVLDGVKMREVVQYAMDRDYRWYVDQLVKQVEGTTGVEGVAQGWTASLDTYPQQLGVAQDTLTGRAITGLENRARQSTVMKPFRKWADAIKYVNTEVENAFRNVAFIQGARRAEREAAGLVDMPALTKTTRRFWVSKEELQRMMIDGVSESNSRRALQLMEQSFGDYSNLSPFERNILRRYLFPFWGFYRHIGQMVLRLPFEHPFKFAVMRGMAQVSEDMRQQFGPLPTWMDGMVPFGPLNPDGSQKFMSVSGPNPFNAFMDIGLSLFHPAVKAGFEMMTGRDAYTGREFSDPDVVTPYGSSQRYRIIRDANGMPVDAVPIDKVTPSLPNELLSQIPQYDMIRQLLAGGKPYDTAGIVQSIGNPMVDSNGNVISPYGPTDAIAKSLGASTYTYDIAGYQQRLEEDKKNALQIAYERWVAENPTAAVG